MTEFARARSPRGDPVGVTDRVAAPSGTRFAGRAHVLKCERCRYPELDRFSFRRRFQRRDRAADIAITPGRVACKVKKPLMSPSIS